MKNTTKGRGKPSTVVYCVLHDGRVTLQEVTDLLLQHFDRMDANHDGQLTPEEREVGRAQMGQTRGH